MLNLGLVINPWAGIGGSVALKGSDNVRDQALALGAEPRANIRTRTALEKLLPWREQLRFHTAAGAMGADVLQQLGFQHQIVYHANGEFTSAADTVAAIKALAAQQLGLILFAGGDGTARDVYSELNALGVSELAPVLGIPAGVKIHSAVYAVSPQAAGEVLADLCQGKPLELTSAQVKDLDEDAYRAGNVRARLFGYLKVPAHPLLQQSKESARAVETQVVDDIAEQIVDEMADDVAYLLGSGTTCMAIKQRLGIEGSLLGVDVVKAGQLLSKDATEATLWNLLQNEPKAALVVTVIGGQGHVFGRGNQQLSPRILRRLGRQAISVVASPGKLQSLQGRPLLTDSGDPELDRDYSGPIRVVTGYRSEALYPLQ
ncbi:ATP-NAD kinase family protein [Permianibacter sp. IMCC34836]|nr:ATP-NAD kinase family protein [Permianibacter fluminis]